MKNRLILHKLKSIGFVDRGACEGAEVIIAKRADDDPDNPDPEDTDDVPAEEPVEAEPEAPPVEKGKGKKKTKVVLEEEDDDEDMDEASVEDDDEEEEETAMKKQDATSPAAGSVVSPTEEVVAKAELVAAQQRIEQLEKRAAEAEEVIKAERDLRLTREWVDRARGIKGVADPDAFGPVLKRLSDGTATGDDVNAVITRLNALGEQVEKAGLFGEIGKAAGADNPSAWDRLVSVAKGLRETNPALTEAQAIAKAAAANPGLYAEYRREAQ